MSVTSFFVNVVARSLEGQIFLAGALASATAVVLTLLYPGAVATSPARASVNATLFGMWPIIIVTKLYQFGIFAAKEVFAERDKDGQVN